MERIEKEFKGTTVYYKSWDGEIFRNEEECIAHENKPTVKAWHDVQGFLIRKVTEYNMFSVFDLGEEQYPAYIFKPETHEDIVALNTYINTDQWGTYKGKEYVNDSWIGKNIFIYNPYTKIPHLMEDMVSEFKKHLEYVLNCDEIDTDYDDDEEKIIRER